jgi:glycogen synthase
LRNVDVFESDFRLEWMDDPWEDVRRAGDWLLEIEQRFRPDLVHLNNYAHGVLRWSAPALVVGHSCVLSWWEAVKNGAAPDCWDVYRDAVGTGLQNAHYIVAPSRAMLRCLDRFYGPFSRTAVVPNGRGRNAWEDRNKGHLVLTAGRLWDEAKNVQALARVAHRLPWPTCVAGEVRNPNGQTSRFENVHLLGRLTLNEMENWYGQASIYVLPARYEPFGLSALEAASHGCALMLGDIPSLREVWGDAALFVSPNDDEELARTLLALMNDDELRGDYAARALARSREYTVERMIEGYLRIYGEILDGKNLAMSDNPLTTKREEVCA